MRVNLTDFYPLPRSGCKFTISTEFCFIKCMFWYFKQLILLPLIAFLTTVRRHEVVGEGDR